DQDPLKLLYVKNGGAVLAKLPTVPGHLPEVVADPGSDDMRLQAEAYIRGVQNAITDLVAIRRLLGARIRIRLRKGEMRDAQELMAKLKAQPTHQILADDMDRKKAEYSEQIGRNAQQRRKVDEMFDTTQVLLEKNIGDRFINALQDDIIRAEKNGGVLPPDKE
ncbi:MAG: hypothetical protein AAGA03_08760, partial [Planctomycetota bacterium]